MMDVATLARLGEGDEVRWDDPDDGRCSRWLIIEAIEVRGDAVRILAVDGTCLECFARELS